MKNLANIISSFILLTGLFLITSCENEIVEPVADFQLLDQLGIESVSADNIEINKTIIFEANPSDIKSPLE